MPSADPQTPTPASVLEVLAQQRLLDISRTFGIGLQGGRETKSRMADWVGQQLGTQLPAVLRELGRDELRAVCRRHGLDGDSRSRAELQARVLRAAGLDPGRSVPPPPDHHRDHLPRAGQVVQARHRQWMVEDVQLGLEEDSALVRLVCLDDDAAGEALDLLWDLEVGARVVDPAAEGLDPRGRLDPPGHFGAYLHALRWSAVSAADATRFQAPFRAGIKLMAHQLTPLMKALELPRANLFIADDVGLGKTIEAGLVLQELILRQQAELVLVTCPAAICLQWRDEMQRRFGLHFEVMTQRFVAYRRKERGFGVNPWSTHNRFIISHQLLRSPDYREPLLTHLGPRARKSLLIVDEAHVAAPASRSKYAVDSHTTETIRDLATRFDNRLFLSATPHNGHSNSFSALLEILDPVRFTRGVPISGPEELAPVMVRRLKRDLRKLGVERFPRRILVRLDLEHDGQTWTSTPTRFDAETNAQERGTMTPVGEGEPDRAPPRRDARPLHRALRAAQRLRAPPVHPPAAAPPVEPRGLRPDARGPRPRGDGARRAHPRRGHPTPRARRRRGPGSVRRRRGRSRSRGRPRRREGERVPAEPDRRGPRPVVRPARDGRARSSPPDAKVRALLSWMREHQCPAVGLDAKADVDRTWTDRRVLLFTE